MTSTTTTSVPTIGTKIGEVLPPLVLAGWPIIATGDGRSVVSSPSGACHHRVDGTVPTDLAWDAVGAYFAAKRDASVQS